MFLRLRRNLSVSLVFCLAATLAAAQEDALRPEYLAKAVRHLVADRRAGSAYLFLENEFPEFSSILKKSGLADLLDGRLTIETFEENWRVQKALYESEGGKLAPAWSDRLFSAFREALASCPAEPPPVGRRVEDLKAPDRVEWLRNRMYQAGDHLLRDWSQLRSVEVAEVPGKVIWFNPDIAIPELGIKPGVPLTEAQEAALVKLFGVRVAHEVPGQPRVGTAAAPADVGRAFNTANKALTIVEGDSGRILGELTLKGTGLNPATATQRVWNMDSPIGHLVTDEGLTDSEVGLRLSRAGVRAYLPVALIDVSEIPGEGMLGVGRVVSVRASESLVRWAPHLTRAIVTEQEIRDTRLLLEYTAREVGLNEVGRPLSVAEWAGQFLPAQQGRMAGILAELGFKHTNHTGNVGPGFVMDFGESAFFHRSSPNQHYVDWFRSSLRDMLRSTNLTLSPAEKVDVEAATRKFDGAVEEGRAHVRANRPRLQISDRHLRKLYQTQVGHLLEGYREWIVGLGATSGAFPDPALKAVKEKALRAEMVKWGLKPPTEAAAEAFAMSKTLVEAIDARKDSTSGLREMLEIVGGVEKYAPIEALKGKTLEVLRAEATAAGITGVQGMNRSMIERALLRKSDPAGQANRSPGSVKPRIRFEAMQAGKFGVAYLGNAAAASVVERDPARMAMALKDMATWEFAGGLAAFTAASRAAEAGLKRPTVQRHLGARVTPHLRSGVSLAAGMSAVQLLAGERDPRRIGLSIGTFAGAGYLVSGVGDRGLTTALKALGRSGALGGRARGAFEIAKLTATLFAGERIEGAVAPRLFP